jgi:glycerophosphoryl diester phosphodiesterase
VTAGQRPAGASRAPLCIAHRGASASAPENTLAAFERAFDDGADWIECDVRLTADGAPIVLHDATLERTTDGRGPAARRTLAEVRRLDAGAWFGRRFARQPVPTLTEVLECARHRGGVNVELKCDPAAGPVREAHRRLARAVAAAIAAARFPGPIVVSSFSRPALRAARAAMPRVCLGYLVSRSARGTRALHRAIGLWSLHPHVRLATPARFAAARRLGLRLLAWGVDDPGDARRLAALGADGLMADDPAALGRVLGGHPGAS